MARGIGRGGIMLVESVLPLIGQTGGTIQGDRNRATATGRPHGPLKMEPPGKFIQDNFSHPECIYVCSGYTVLTRHVRNG